MKNKLKSEKRANPQVETFQVRSWSFKKKAHQEIIQARKEAREEIIQARKEAHETQLTCTNTLLLGLKEIARIMKD